MKQQVFEMPSSGIDCFNHIDGMIDELGVVSGR
jgi:hypothetical protein